MSKYMKVAADANPIAQEILDLIPEADKPKAARAIARLFNMGIRVAPRGVQSTVRINAIKEAMKGLPVRCYLEERTDERTGSTYKALVTE